MNYDFSISEINFTGDREVNVKMKERLNNYIINKKNKNFKVDILSIATKTVSAKNISGDATNLKSTVSIKVDLVMNNKLKNNFIITESFNYNNQRMHQGINKIPDAEILESSGFIKKMKILSPETGE